MLCFPQITNEAIGFLTWKQYLIAVKKERIKSKEVIFNSSEEGAYYDTG